MPRIFVTTEDGITHHVDIPQHMKAGPDGSGGLLAPQCTLKWKWHYGNMVAHCTDGPAISTQDGDIYCINGYVVNDTHLFCDYSKMDDETKFLWILRHGDKLGIDKPQEIGHTLQTVKYFSWYQFVSEGV